MRRPLTRRGALLVAAGITISACSGSAEQASESTASAPSEPGASTTVDADGSGTADDVGSSTTPDATAPPSTVASTSTTTAEPPPRVVPAGVRWTPGQTLLEVDSQLAVQDLIEVDEEVWVLGTRYNGLAVFRSRDAGTTWEPVQLADPPSQGTLDLQSVVRGADGRLVAAASRGSRCQASQDVGNGYRYTGFCKRFRPTLFVSDDDGASWREVEPPAMAPPGDVSVVLASVVASADGYLAAGTVRGPDWHGRLWSSPDGETWTLDREIRGESRYASVEQLLTDGDTVVVLVSEHPCGTPDDNTAGWILGAAWVRWLKIYNGTSMTDLALLEAADHPFLRDLDISDCEFTASVAGVLEINEATPSAHGMVVGGVITLLESPRPTAEDVAAEEAGDDEAAMTSGLRRVSQLVDGAWTLHEVTGVRSADSGHESRLLDVDGEPGFFESRHHGTGLELLVPILPDGDRTWSQREPETPVIARSVEAGAWVGGGLVAVGVTRRDPFETTISPGNSQMLVAFRSTEAVGDPPPCELGPNAVCQFADLSLVDGYPDFAGLDLAGVDLAFADLGNADLSGSNLTGATLWHVRSSSDGTMRGAILIDAALQGAWIRNAVDANLSGANLRTATIGDATGALFTGALLDRSQLGIPDLSVLDGMVLTGARLDFLVPTTGPYEVSLAGIDLTDVTISGAFDGPLLKVLDLGGAILDGTDFRRVDLTAIDPAVDLSDVDVWDDSICPDGLPPDDPPIGTCVRTMAEG